MLLPLFLILFPFFFPIFPSNETAVKTGNRLLEYPAEIDCMWFSKKGRKADSCEAPMHARLGKKKGYIDGMLSQKTGNLGVVFCEYFKIFYTIPSVESIASIFRLDRQ